MRAWTLQSITTISVCINLLLFVFLACEKLLEDVDSKLWALSFILDVRVEDEYAWWSL